MTVSIVNEPASDEVYTEFDAHTFLSTIGEGKVMLSFQKRAKIFVQGDSRDGLFFIQSGIVSLSVLSENGKSATFGILGAGDSLGEGGIAGQLSRMSSATALTDCLLLYIERSAMVHAMSAEPTLSALFVTYLLKRNIRYQDDLVDHLFNFSEKRLARIFLLMARFGEEGISQISIPRLSQETLAEIVGTTRSRVCFFMNQFRDLGFIHYGAGDSLLIHSSLLNFVLPGGAETRVTVGAENRNAGAEKGTDAPLAVASQRLMPEVDHNIGSVQEIQSSVATYSSTSSNLPSRNGYGR